MRQRIKQFLALGGGASIAIFVAGLTTACFQEGAHATLNKVSTATANISNGIAIRILDKTGNYDIDSLNLAFASEPDGAFASDSFIASVSTPNASGYKLYMNSTYEADSSYTTALTNIEDANYSIPTLSTNNVSLADFSKKNSPYMNMWGYSKSWDGGGDASTFGPIAAHTGNDLIREETGKVLNSNTTITVGINANMQIPSGTYRNELTFSAVANPPEISYTLNFDANSGTNAPDNITQSSAAGQVTFTIPDAMPAKNGYGFLGWNEDPSATTATYVAGDTYTIVAESTEPQSKTLYAVWGAPTFWNIASMQQMTNTICNSVYTPNNGTGSNITLVDNAYDYYTTYNVTTDGTRYVPQRTLYDIRDNNSYTVRKLADGNCWMTENLRLVGPKMLTSDSSDIGTNNFDLPASNDGTWCTDVTPECHNQPLALISNNQAYGAYYNWYTATAGSGTYETTSDTKAAYSLCPKNWRLPIGGSSSSEFNDLYIQYNEPLMWLDSPLSFVLSGRKIGESVASMNGEGFYWSSVARGNGVTYNLAMARSVIRPLNNNHKYYGETIRCIAN